MQVTKITANKDTLVLSTSSAPAGALLVREQAPTIPAETASQYALLEVTPAGGEVSIPRCDGPRDRLTSRFTVWSADGRQRAEGVQFVTDFTPEARAWNAPYPQATSKKGTHVYGADAKALGVQHATMNVNLCQLFSALPGEDTEPYEFNGRTFYLREQVAASYDQAVLAYYRDGTNLSMIVLNSPKMFGADNDPLLNALAVHPKYDGKAFISAFNMRTDDGIAYYGAFLDYLASRYMRADGRYGRITGFIVSNEVDLQSDWGNAGDMPMEQYVGEYTGALRLAWLTAQKYWSAGRAYISLAHFFNTAGDPTRPLRFYKGREVLETLNKYAQQDGNFGWNVAYHPYCESFYAPDFWNDRSATFDFSTPRITFKNIEVLPAYLAQEHLLYRGQPRRIIFSEQGFNSWDAESEEVGYAAYCLAYKKIEKQPGIEAFIYHAYADNRGEFGLNLGLRKWGDAPGEVGAPKPAYYAMRAMGTAEEPAALAKAKAFVGERTWERILNPRVLAGDRDTTQEQEFGAAGGQADDKK
ncbi:MAG: DUF5722 domain-containing protein [Anaerolineae bacterium]